MRRLSFGISVTPYAADYPALVGQVLAAERDGLELVGIQDHPYQRRFLDTFSLIADLLARTQRLSFFPDVANLPLRGPVMIAKAAVSMDVMSGGRFELGIGAGAFWEAMEGMGFRRRSPREAVDALAEAMAIVRGVFDAERVIRGPGPHYPVPGYPSGPPPAHRIGIWVGAYGRRALGLTGRAADGWVPSLFTLGPDRYGAARRHLDEAALAAGRNPNEIRRLYNISGAFTMGERGAGPLDGPVSQWIDTLTEWHLELGIDTFIYWPPDSGTADIERFAVEVVPGISAATGNGG